MPATVISPSDFEVMQSLARAVRVHVDALPDGPEIVGAMSRGLYLFAPETPPRHGKLIAATLELLRNPELSQEQSVALRASFFGVE
jgi:hypothetical protein